MKLFTTALITAALHAGAWAQSSPVGVWRTIDDETKQERSLVRIEEQGGMLVGRIEKVADATRQDAICNECSDDRKGKPMLGMTIIRGVKQNDKASWEGGEILDPTNGKTYRVRLTPIDGGKALEVRGYIGSPLFGRTQTWIRAQ